MHGMGAWNVTLLAEETKVLGDMAYDRGTFVMTMTPKDGSPNVTENGKYLVLLQRGADGLWKVAREIGNSNDPMVPPPDPKAAKVAPKQK